jgi:hypothetical protein
MTAPAIDTGNTDPATVVSIAQDPAKPDGWNIVTLSTDAVWKYAGVVERAENGFIVQRVALTDNVTGEIGPDGPVITDAVRAMIEAVGGTVPPIHVTKVIPPDAPPVDAATPAPTAAEVRQALPVILSSLTQAATAQGHVAGYSPVHNILADIRNAFEKFFSQL